MVYSSYAALAGGNHVGILIKSAPREKMIPYILPVHTEDIYWLRSDSETTSIRNQFLDDKHERRITTVLAQGSTITVAELPEGISAKIYQLAGLMKGDYEDDIIKVLAQRGKVALDMQGYLRVPDSSTKEMVYHVFSGGIWNPEIALHIQRNLAPLRQDLDNAVSYTHLCASTVVIRRSCLSSRN